MLKVVIAGGSGYVGQALIASLLEKNEDIEIIALSRKDHPSHDARLSWKACDLFSLKSLEEAVPDDVDVAYYLVHSMGPTAKLDQGSFADYDLLLADNFLRRLKNTKTRRIVYLAGLIPERNHLSLHLQSRLEVEETFLGSKIPVTVFRAGLIVGQGGSSFQILTRLVSRLPVMVCPRWTQTLTTPIDLPAVVRALRVELSRTESSKHVYDLAGCEPLTYVEMMRETARAMGRKRLFIAVPLFTPTLSRLWVRLITGAPKELVYPLVESLKHQMTARPSHILERVPIGKTYSQLIVGIPLEPEKEAAHQSAPVRVGRKTVRSVQRLPLPHGRSAEWVTALYIRWLPTIFAPFLKVRVEGDLVQFCVVSKKWVMLELRHHPERSTA